ncbi:MAG: hypothetical protein AAB520_02465 [Patescibacteria group bacterium]
MRTRRKQSKALWALHYSRYLLMFVAFLVLLTFAERTKITQRLVPTNNYYEKPKTITVKQNLKYNVPTPIPTQAPFNWSVVKVDDHITKISLPSDSSMSTPDELFNAMNSYRGAHGVSILLKSDTLCSIAQKRADEQLVNGDLDNHAGFSKYAEGQNEFSRMGEVLFGGAQPQYGVHIVEYGWDRSLTGHKEAIQDPSWQYGCAGIAGYYAVFIFGTH